MFTGIITATGTVERVADHNGGRDLELRSPWHDVTVGESIAIDGACLTVTGVTSHSFSVHVITTSLERTRFAAAVVGQRMNLERALRAGDRFGGHLVQGHVDGVGKVVNVREHGDARLLDITAPEAVASVSVPLGSVTVDGVSLTLNALPAPDTLQVSLIPFTLDHTTLGERRPGDLVHLEGDTVGKYVQHLMAARRPA